MKNKILMILYVARVFLKVIFSLSYEKNKKYLKKPNTLEEAVDCACFYINAMDKKGKKFLYDLKSTSEFSKVLTVVYGNGFIISTSLGNKNSSLYKDIEKRFHLENPLEMQELIFKCTYQALHKQKITPVDFSREYEEVPILKKQFHDYEIDYDTKELKVEYQKNCEICKNIFFTKNENSSICSKCLN